MESGIPSKGTGKDRGKHIRRSQILRSSNKVRYLRIDSQIGFHFRVKGFNGQFRKMGDLDKIPSQHGTIHGPVGIVPERGRP